MATYKVIQDIEAEDKLVGPLSLRQFIYAIIVILLCVASWYLAHVAIWLPIPLLPFIVLFGLLAAPFMQDQPSEIWLLAKIRFILKPRLRIWDQDGLQELVTVTAPKNVERHLTDNLSQTEVKSRLQALANTIDSRGWAVKNVDLGALAQPMYATGNSDRLIDTSSMAVQAPGYEVSFENDILDERNNPTAQALDKMIAQSSAQHRTTLVNQMKQAADPSSQATPANQPPSGYWFANNPAPALAQPYPPASSDDTGMDEATFLNKLHQEQNRPDPMHSRLKVIEPLSAKKKHSSKAKHAKAEAKPAPEPRKPTTDPVIIELARRDDLMLDTVSRVARAEKHGLDDEVVIKLH